MPKKKKGSSKFKKKGQSGVHLQEKLILRQEDANEHYAKVVSNFGGGRFGVKLVCVRSDGDILFSSRVHLGILPGRMRRQKWKHFVTINDIVLVGCREFETEDRKVDILHKYTADAAKQLIKMGSIPNEDGFDATSDVAFTLESGSSVEMCPTAVAGSKSSVAPAAAVTITEDSSATAPYTGASVVADDWEETFDDI